MIMCQNGVKIGALRHMTMVTLAGRGQPGRGKAGLPHERRVTRRNESET